MRITKHLVLGGIGVLLVLAPSALHAQKVQFSITNTAPLNNGVWTMRPWIGVHDGNFPTFLVGQPASTGVQHIAEDGVTGDVTNVLPPPNVCKGLASVYSPSAPCMFEIFNNYANHGPQATLGNPTRPGKTLSTVFQLDHKNANNQYLSYLVMIVPSNDAFFGTDSVHPIRLFRNGRFNDGEGPIHFIVFGSDILDAGTEANDEGASGQMDTAFLNQKVNGTGTHPDPADPTVHKHPGFIPGGPILTGCNMFGGTLNCFFNADFTQPGYQVSEVTIEVVTGSVDALIALLNSLSLDSGIAQSLSAKLQNAKTMLDGGDFNSGCGMLGAFGNEVSAQTGRMIPGGTAASLLAALSDASQADGCN